MSKKDAAPDGQTSEQNAGQTHERTSGQTHGQVMYTGPTLLRPVLLSRRSVYTVIPAAVRKFVDQDKDLAACFVPLSEAGRALRELEGAPGTQPGVYSRCYGAVKKRYLDEVKK
ncbi:MAG: hypothetical protein LBH14_06210 [Desulfobulbaceae bacterium]|jgi:hypothetical protein|nr:hypothetical protein [Desulfobulbaceae bacterium]